MPVSPLPRPSALPPLPCSRPSKRCQPLRAPPCGARALRPRSRVSSTFVSLRVSRSLSRCRRARRKTLGRPAPPPYCAKTAFLKVLSLCLSRACLGKMSIYIYKWRENTVLTHHSRGWTSEPVHMTSSHFFLAECGEPGRIKFCIPMILAASCRTQSAERRAARRPRSQTDKVVHEKTERKVPEMERRRRKRRSSAHTACFPFVSSGQCTFQCPCKKKTHLSLFSVQLSLCLSRACLGRMVIFCIKNGQRRRFILSYRLATMVAHLTRLLLAQLVV